jgi:hypothetical protein
VDYYGWTPYVYCARRRQAARRGEARDERPADLAGGHRWPQDRQNVLGQAWYGNLERYATSRTGCRAAGPTFVTPGGRSADRPGAVRAMVNGSDLYRIEVKVAAVPKARWTAVCGTAGPSTRSSSCCRGVSGRDDASVRKTGLFPSPGDRIHVQLSRLASMCKHVAAVLYGIGARLTSSRTCSRCAR